MYNLNIILYTEYYVRVFPGVIAEGKDKLEWYRQVDPAKLNTLKELIASPNYKVIIDNCSLLQGDCW